MPESGRTQRKDSVEMEAAPHRWLLGQGKARMIAGIASASTALVARPGFSVTANHTPSRSVSCSFARPVLRRKPSSACSGADVRGPFTSSDTACVASGRSRAISARRRGVDQTVTSPAFSPAASSSLRNSFSRSARAAACMRAGISSLRSSRRKSVTCSTPGIARPTGLRNWPCTLRTTRARDRARGPCSWRVPAPRSRRAPAAG
ncbi:hypothetical protein NOLU111490_13530 [Novosphingobium lubricantis]